jgi:hypothetical protein
MTDNIGVAILLSVLCTTIVYAQDCVTCHKQRTPGIVTDWQLSHGPD